MEALEALLKSTYQSAYDQHPAFITQRRSRRGDEDDEDDDDLEGDRAARLVSSTAASTGLSESVTELSARVVTVEKARQILSHIEFKELRVPPRGDFGAASDCLFVPVAPRAAAAAPVHP
jgi:hypothetical protein